MFDTRRIKMMDAVGIDVSVLSLSCPNVYWGAPEGQPQGRAPDERRHGPARETPPRPHRVPVLAAVAARLKQRWPS